jgi:hypothetical protein
VKWWFGAEIGWKDLTASKILSQDYQAESESLDGRYAVNPS